MLPPNFGIRNRFLALLLLIAACVWPATGSTIYDVNTSAGSGGFNPSTGGCSVAIDYDSRSGPSGGSPTPVCPWLAYSASGTSTLGQTASFDSTSASGTDGSASASYASASLATGTMHLYTSNTIGTGGITAPSYADAQLVDQLTFNVPGATASTLTTISFNYSLDGLFSGRDAADEVVTYLGFGGGQIGVEWTGTLSPFVYVGSGWGNAQNISCLTTSCFDISGSFTVQGANPSVGFDLTQELTCSGHDDCTENYENTGTFTLSLPSGVTYTSDSGVFLTQSSVPEPSYIGICALCLIGASLVRARTRLYK